MHLYIQRQHIYVHIHCICWKAQTRGIGWWARLVHIKTLSGMLNPIGDIVTSNIPQSIYSQAARGFISSACRHCVRTSSQSSWADASSESQQQGFASTGIAFAPSYKFPKCATDFWQRRFSSPPSACLVPVGICRPPSSTSMATLKRRPGALTPAACPQSFTNETVWLQMSHAIAWQAETNHECQFPNSSFAQGMSFHTCPLSRQRYSQSAAMLCDSEQLRDHSFSYLNCGISNKETVNHKI